MTSGSNVNNFEGDSQNFILRFSDSSTSESICNPVADYRKEDETDVIVISDSGSCSSPEYSEQLNQRSILDLQKNAKYKRLYISQTSSENEEGRINLPWRINVRSNIKSLNKKDISVNNVQNKEISYSSNQTTASSSSNNIRYDRNIKNQIKFDTKRLHKNSTLNMEQRIKSPNTNANKKHEMHTFNQTNETVTPGHSSHSDGSRVINRLNQCTILNSPQKDNIGKVRYRNDDVHSAFNDKYKHIVPDYPSKKKDINVIIDESTDFDDIHPAISPKSRANYRNNIRNAEVNTRNNVIPDSLPDSPESNKTYADKSSDLPKEEELYKPLSEKKKLQITEWLMSNRPDSLSDSSCSIIPPSVRNSLESGNDSLERLELHYETPNNRDKFNEIYANEKQTTVITNCERKVELTSPHRVTPNRFVQKSKNNNVEIQTSDKSKISLKDHTIKKKLSKPPSVPRIAKEDLKEQKDYASILDTLYGKSWRDKADLILPSSEPRKKAVQTIIRPIQTERKPRLKDKYCVTDSDESDSVKNNVKLNSKTKIQRRHKKRDTFINDDLSSDDDESIYHTALTDPRIFTKNVVSKPWHSKPTPASTITTRILSVCDTDIEDELDDKSSKNSRKSLRRRRLSFSDDDSSKTSEFDPGDVVPPKSTSKKIEKHIVKTPFKATINSNTKSQSVTTSRSVEYKCFLASLSSIVQLSNAHPDARRYKLDYKNQKEELCCRLYNLYNEKVFDNKLPKDMSIEWNVRMRGTAGFCYNKKSVKSLSGVTRSSRIVLATKILDTPDRLRDTLIHEMCHAAAWLINGVADGHGPFWTGWASKAMKTFPELPPIRRCHDYEIRTKFTYRCTSCGYSIGRHSKSLNIEKKRCGHCYGKFELLINKTTKSGTVQKQTPKREPTGFALFVKQNYSSVKRKGNNIKHADVMKLLGQQFSAIKLAKENNFTEEK